MRNVANNRVEIPALVRSQKLSNVERDQDQMGDHLEMLGGVYYLFMAGICMRLEPNLFSWNILLRSVNNQCSLQQNLETKLIADETQSAIRVSL